MSHINNELNQLNHMIFKIIHDMANGDNSRSEIEYLFSEITNLRQKYEHLLLDSEEIEELERLLTDKKLQREQLKAQFTSITDEFRAKAIAEFGEKIGGQLTDRLWVHQGLTIIKLKPEIDEKLRMPDFKQILERVDKNLLMTNDLNRPIDRLNNRKIELDNISRAAKENIEFLDSFRLYCNQLIHNYKDVVRLSNENNRLFQVSLIFTNEVHTHKTVWNDVEDLHPLKRTDRLASEQSDHVFSDAAFYERQFSNSDTFDVFDEDTEYYYGIYEGQSAFTRKNNCVKVDNPQACLFPFFVMTNRLANQILLGNYLGLEHSSTSCPLLLFEHSQCVVLDPILFSTYHSHYSDDVPSLVPECCHYIHSLQDTSENTLRTSLLSLSMQSQHDDFIFSVTYNSPVMQNNFKRLLCRNFISLLKSQERSINKKVLLQNMKCLFAKTAVNQVKLYRDIDSELTVMSSAFDRYEFGSLYPDRSDFRLHTETLLDIFIPEIQFLLLIRSIFALRLVRPPIQIEPVYIHRWEMYLAANNLGKDATPEDYLSYLCRDVLSNLISLEIYEQIMALSIKMTILLLDRLFKKEFCNPATYLIKAIHRIVNRLFRDNKNGGKRIRNMKSKKKRAQNKKSRK